MLALYNVVTNFQVKSLISSVADDDEPINEDTPSLEEEENVDHSLAETADI